jgi:hypothetical protein
VTNSGRWKSKEKRMDLGAALTGVVDMEWMGPKAVGGDGDEAEARCICANAEEVEHGLEVVERAGTSEEASEVRIVAASRGGVAPRAGGHQSLVTDEVLQRTTVVTIGRKQTSGEEGAEGVQRNEEVTQNAQEATAEEGGGGGVAMAEGAVIGGGEDADASSDLGAPGKIPRTRRCSSTRRIERWRWRRLGWTEAAERR